MNSIGNILIKKYSSILNCTIYNIKPDDYKARMSHNNLILDVTRLLIR